MARRPRDKDGPAREGRDEPPTRDDVEAAVRDVLDALKPRARRRPASARPASKPKDGGR